MGQGPEHAFESKQSKKVASNAARGEPSRGEASPIARPMPCGRPRPSASTLGQRTAVSANQTRLPPEGSGARKRANTGNSSMSFEQAVQAGAARQGNASATQPRYRPRADTLDRLTLQTGNLELRDSDTPSASGRSSALVPPKTPTSPARKKAPTWSGQSSSRKPIAPRSPVVEKVRASLAKYHATEQPVTIAYRTCEYGIGAFWDHYTLQKTLHRPTFASHHAAETPVRIESRPAERPHARFAGPFGQNPSHGKGEGKGLLVFTGGRFGLDSEVGRQREHTPTGEAAIRHGRRVSHERELLRKARLKGRPILGICGGSWRIVEGYGGTTRNLPRRTHQARAMPFLTAAGSVSNNLKDHDVVVEQNTILAKLHAVVGPRLVHSAAAGPKAGEAPPEIRFRANSVHWAAIDRLEAGQVPMLLEVSAHDDGTCSPAAPSGKSSSLLGASAVPKNQSPSVSGSRSPHAEKTIEAFEATFGAPIFGIQWHPEVYGSGLGHDNEPAAEISRTLLHFLAKAGDAYEARRAMNLEFRRTCEQGKRRRPCADDRRHLPDSNEETLHWVLKRSAPYQPEEEDPAINRLRWDHVDDTDAKPGPSSN